MFCQTCGEKIESKDLKFCASCGSEITDTPSAPSEPPIKTEENQVSSPVKSVTVSEPKKINVGGPGPHSKKTLAFAIVSLVLAGIGFALGGTMSIRMMNPYYYYSYNYVFAFIALMVGVVFNVTGLIFGILSRTNCSKARKVEPANGLEKVGSIFAIFGIIINSIPVVVILGMLIIALISNIIFMTMYSTI